ncbi:MAG: TlpA disulfide reductase family protein [Acidobacteriota bacterium]|nr:TlpA disulfide reductase family protein [Acidobacteriota bacterium]
MNRRLRGALWAALALVVAIAAARVGQAALSARQQATPDAPAEGGGDATLLDGYDATVLTASGDPVLLSEIADGRPLVINFWATWCPYCVDELPDFQDIYATYGDRVSFAFVDVADGRRETVDAAVSWVAEQGFDDLPVFFDTSLEASGRFGARSLPTTVIVAADGTIQTVTTGRIDPALVRGALEAMV